MGRELPEHPTLFAKFRCTLIGANDEIVLPAVSEKVDWEAELAVIIGRRARHVSEADATGAIAGYAVLNDISARDYQDRTLQWLQGKTFEGTTPLGPWLVTSDEAGGPSREITCEVEGETMQKSDTADLVFSPAALVSYISSIVTLEPGDVIATGTPGGVGHARKPPRYLADGETVVTRIAGLGECRNVCRKERIG
jgi:acylpyruvate hydrolase